MTNMLVKPVNKKEYIFLVELFNKMKIAFKPLEYDIDADDNNDWYGFSSMNLSRAYSDEEPEYSSAMVKEPNPDYKPSIESNL